METTKLELRTALGPLYPDIKQAAVKTVFFYTNHGTPAETIAKAKDQVINFMKQPARIKDLISSRKYSKYSNGYVGPKITNISPTEGIDVMESFSFRYRPEVDPDHPVDISEVPEEIKQWIQGEELVWESTSHLPEFKKDLISNWQAQLTLARKLVRGFALSLGLAEDYWDNKVSHPGADSVFNYYPPRNEEETEKKFVSPGSHTDLQLFTLLWQDSVGGLQVLTNEGQWIKVPPIEGTIVVNIGDYMMRLCNDIYKSTVHRVANESTLERVSMPFFFGLNFNCIESTVPSCITDENPKKHEPISCGDWCQMRFKIEREAFEKKQAAASSLAPSSTVVVV